MLTNNQVKEYYSNGFLIIQNFFDTCLNEKNKHRLRYYKNRKGEAIIEKIDPIIDISKKFKEISNDKNILEVAKKLLKADKVFLFRDKLIPKLPTQMGYPLHQDYNWWHELNPDNILTIAIAIDSSNENNGAIEFFPKMHNEIILPKGSNRGFNNYEMEKFDNVESVSTFLNEGDILIFHSLAPHYSNANYSNQSRRMFYVGYNNGIDGNIYDNYSKKHSSFRKNM